MQAQAGKLGAQMSASTPGLRQDAIAQLGAGFWVGHANTELADWEGVITPDGGGQWSTLRFGGDVRVRWHAGLDGQWKPMAGTASWIEATAVTIKGECPDCRRPAHQVLAGNPYGRIPGWYHDANVDRDTCWVGKAAFEAASRPGAAEQEADR